MHVKPYLIVHIRIMLL